MSLIAALSGSAAVGLIAAGIAAAGSIVAAVLVARQSARSQSYEQLLKDMASLLTDSEERIERAVKKALRRVIGTRTPHRRFYEGGDDDED